MNAQLKHLIDLQKLDLKIVDCENRAAQVPGQLDTLDQTIQQARKDLEETRQQLEEDKKRHRLLEGDVESLREKLSKFKSQLMEVKTNKEYQAVLHEIENAEKQIGDREDQILERMMAIEEREENVGRIEGEQKRKEQEILKKRNKLENVVSEVQSQILSLQQERTQLERAISGQLTDQYRKIASVRKGLALAEAKDQSCQACNVKLRPQFFNEIKSNLQIVTCENCNRILYYAEP